MLVFALLTSAAAGVLSGVAPALQAGREDLISSLRERGGGSGRVRLRKTIVTLQIAFSLILSIGATLFARTLIELLSKGPGFATSRLVSFGLHPLISGYSPAEASKLIRRIHTDLRAQGIAEGSAVARFPLLTGGSWNDPMTIQTNERITTDRDVNLNSVSPGFFQTLGVRMLAGRDFDVRDSRPPGERGIRSAIVNDSFVQRYLRGRNPLGTLICEKAGPDAKPDIEVVGVVADFSYRGIREQSEQAFFPIFEGDDAQGTFYVRVRGTPENAFETIRTIVRKADSALPITFLRTVDEQVDRSLVTERMLATLSAAFGFLAIAISLVGLYGVMSFVVAQRTREIGIRLALGATPGSAMLLVLGEAVLMIATAVGIALPAAGALGRVVESQLFGVKPMDPVAIAVATAILASAAIAASLAPAYRASSVDPAEALRFE
jgi:predicted permease